MTKPELLVLLDRPAEDFQIFEADYRTHYAPTPQQRQAVIRGAGQRFAAVVTSGSLGLTSDEIDLMPNLRIICCSGSGYDGIATSYAASRGIQVTNSPTANTECVADHAIALLFSLVRGIVEWDGSVRRGLWSELQWERPSISGKRLGLLGLGAVGGALARRLSGFDMAISYHTRQMRPEAGYIWRPSVVDLARNADFLIATLPGNAETHHIINAEVLGALGPGGYLVNVGRGSLVDNTALIAALENEAIAGAALDVVDGEPDISPHLLQMPNLIITPHVAWLSPESRARSLHMVLQNLSAFFAGRRLANAVPADT